jgi:Phage integrase family
MARIAFGGALDGREQRRASLAGETTELGREGGIESGAACAGGGDGGFDALAFLGVEPGEHGVDVGELLTTWQAGGRRNGGFKSFLHHVAKDKPQARRAIALKVPKKVPRVVTVAEMQAILDACEHLRDRFLFALLWDSGVRIGAALGLRHADIAAAGRTVTIVPRDNANGARCKSRQQHTIPVSAPRSNKAVVHPPCTRLRHAVGGWRYARRPCGPGPARCGDPPRIPAGTYGHGVDVFSRLSNSPIR